MPRNWTNSPFVFLPAPSLCWMKWKWHFLLIDLSNYTFHLPGTRQPPCKSAIQDHCFGAIFLNPPTCASLGSRSQNSLLNSQYLSKTPAAPWPVPTHMVTMPYLPPVRLRSFIICTVSLAPVQPSGWPRAMAPPLMLSFSGSRPK